MKFVIEKTYQIEGQPLLGPNDEGYVEQCEVCGCRIEVGEQCGIISDLAACSDVVLCMGCIGRGRIVA